MTAATPTPEERAADACPVRTSGSIAHSPTSPDGLCPMCCPFAAASRSAVAEAEARVLDVAAEKWADDWQKYYLGKYRIADRFDRQRSLGEFRAELRSALAAHREREGQS